MNFATNIILTGFMGTGKTTVGQILARKLKREFVDMDAVIEARAGMTIPQIFERRGEDEFRALERRLVYELALRNGLVIATGGGALIDDALRETMLQSGIVVCLNASKADIRERLAENANRPLAAGWESLFEARRSAYAMMPYQILTTGKTPEAIAGEIAALDSGALYVNTPDGGGYPIIVGRGLLDWLTEEAESLGLANHVVVITNETVAPLYGERLVRALPNANLLIVRDGEEHKNLDTVRGIYDKLLALGADRGSTIIALGGGVIGDMAGFVAATYMRGVDLLQMPTTLLSMVDSSVGGKVGVDLPQGKNLIGAFKQPRCVIIDTDVLQTLPPAQWRCGMAEVVKHGLIARPALLNPDLWDLQRAEDLVRQAVQVKIDVVEVDPYERGIRAHLNLGHTFGHAIEKVTEFAIPHGEAVAIGIVKAARLSRNLGLIDEGLVERILKIMWRLELPTDIALDSERWYAAMATDKKWQAGNSRLVVLKSLGEAAIIEGLSKEEICAVL
ncbi:MAG: 3-dehydroquinate synthase [Chloroflexota bacterium]|nr:3-dehydroquinate synthase [Chloroflexota bacterium]MDE2908912.1 3-dehydroquinate synthase [Chloroflexota bacterium]